MSRNKLFFFLIFVYYLFTIAFVFLDKKKRIKSEQSCVYIARHYELANSQLHNTRFFSVVSLMNIKQQRDATLAEDLDVGEQRQRSRRNLFRIVDLNNKETSSMLLKMMKQEEKRQLEKKAHLHKLILKTQYSESAPMPASIPSTFSSSYLSSSSSSSFSSPQSPSCNNSLSNSFHSNCSSSTNSANFFSESFPPYKRIYNSPNYSPMVTCFSSLGCSLCHRDV